MALPRIPVFLAYVVSGLLPLALVPIVLRNRAKPGGLGTLVVIIGASLWSLGFGGGFLLRSQLSGFVAGNVVLLGGALATVGWFLATGEYTGVLVPSRRVLAALAVVPVAGQLLAWTNPLHHLVYGSGVTFQSTANLIENYGVAFWGQIAVTWILVLFGILLVSSEVLTSRGVRRQQSLALLGGAVPPVVLNLVFITQRPVVDPTPFGFAATTGFLAWGLLRAQFLDLVPVGRERAVSEMDDAVVTVDDEGRVVDCNPAARELLDVDANYVGTPADEAFAATPAIRDRYRDPDGTETEVSITRDGRTRHFDLEVSKLDSPGEDAAGRLVVLREITALKEREQALREREEELDLLRQVLARVLRHNIRNDLGVIRGYGEVLADEVDGQHGEMAETLVETADDLVDISDKARSIEQLVDEEQRPREFDLATMLEEVVAAVEASFPRAPIDLDAPDTCTVVASPSLELAFENLVENAVEHTDGDDPTVAVTLDCGDEQAVVTIADNGPGIPDQELAVLDAGEETPLQHGSGIGLWVVQWVFDGVEATMDHETGEDGTTITVRIPR